MHFFRDNISSYLQKHLFSQSSFSLADVHGHLEHINAQNEERKKITFCLHPDLVSKELLLIFLHGATERLHLGAVPCKLWTQNRKIEHLQLNTEQDPKGSRCDRHSHHDPLKKVF